MQVLQIYGTSAVGQVRTVNEDRFLIAGIHENVGGIALQLPATAELLRHPGLLVAVADGMGGHAAGDLASRLALQTLAEQLPHYLLPDMNDDEIMQQLNNLILFADDLIRRQAAAQPQLADMGSTLVGVLLRGNQCCRFHAGDSRLYRFCEGYLQQLTLDHSPAGMLARQGIAVENSSREITNSLGGGPGMACVPEIKNGVGFVEGDILLLCSDGLSEMVAVQDIENVLQQPLSLAERGEQLVQRANDNGGQDNITVVLIEAR